MARAEQIRRVPSRMKPVTLARQEREARMPIINRIGEFHAEMTAWRRDLHAHPELSMKEYRTSGVVQAKLREFGVDDIITGMAETGVVGVIRGRPGSTRAVGLRADMDALPMQEESGLAHASQTPGVMHACGHDGHTTMLLGAAKYLAETRNFDGTVYVIFQPAEEYEAGGDKMVKDGLFQRCPMEMVFGLHNWPGAPAGRFLWRSGPIMAAVAFFDIVITGKGSHGALPHEGVDPVVVSAQIINALQTIVSRNVNAVEGGVVTIGAITGGDAYNIIPERVTMKGTARWFHPRVGERIEAGMRRIIPGIAESLGAKAELSYFNHAPATINDPAATALTVAAAQAVAGNGQVRELPAPTMGGEDFSYMLNAKQGSYIMLGGGGASDTPQLHHPRYDFNDEILPIGASYWATLAEQFLANDK
jgi:hippurate hydrolase